MNKKITENIIKSFVFCLMLTAIIVFAASCSSPVSNNSPASQNPVVATDTTPPTVTSVTPADRATNVSVSAPNITATFSEPVDKTTVVNTSRFSLTGLGGVSVTGTITYESTSKKATFTPSENLAYSTVYSATIETGVKDLYGNVMIARKTWSFTTSAQPDTTAPTVTQVTPADSATSVSISAPNISAVFSENMDSTTINSSNFTLITQAGAAVTGTVAYDTTNKSASFTPSSDLSYSTVYIASVETGVKDNSGNAMAARKTWSFTTALDPTGSTWTKISPNPSFTARERNTIVSFNGYLYLIGGMANFVKASDVVFRSSDGSNWSQVSVTGLPAVSDHAAVVFDSGDGNGEKIWVIGSYNNKSAVWSSTNGSTWIQVTSEAQFGNREGICGVVFNNGNGNKMYIIGGYNGPSVKTDVWSSSNGSTWTKTADLPSDFGAGIYPAAVVFNSKIWITGGEDSSYVAKSAVWSSSNGSTWTQTNANAEFGTRVAHSMVVFNNKMRLFGGYDGDMSTPTGKTDCWSSTDGITWTNSTNSASYGTKINADACVFNNKIWLIGGKDLSDPSNEVWWSQ